MCVVTEFHTMKGYMLRNVYFQWVTRFKQHEELLSLKRFWHVIGKGLHRFSYLIVWLLLPWENVGLKRKVHKPLVSDDLYEAEWEHQRLRQISWIWIGRKVLNYL